MIKICKNCGNEFSIRQYRANSANYCSRKCCGQKRKEIQYASKHELVTKLCLICSSEFSVPNSSRYIGKKTCSKPCQNKLQTIHLSEYRVENNKKRKKGRTPITKKCIVCGNNFTITDGNYRQQSCGMECGAKLAALNNKKNITKEEFEDAINNCATIQEGCNFLKCSASAIYKCEKKYLLKFPRLNTENKLRPDGYFNYGTKHNHREIYQKYHKITLLPKQGVHHIDNDKNNNDINNLIHTESTREHNLIHNSMEKIGFELFKRGLIGFDRLTKRYFIK